MLLESLTISLTSGQNMLQSFMYWNKTMIGKHANLMCTRAGQKCLLEHCLYTTIG